MRFLLFNLLACLLIVVGCSSSIPKAELESSDPEVVLEKIQGLKKELIQSNTDVLAKKTFKKGDRELKKAIEASDENDSTKEILNHLALSKAYFLQAKEVARTRKFVPKNVLDARKKTTDARVFELHSLKVTLDSIDDSLIDESELFTKQLSTDNLSEFQSKYQKLEIKSVQNYRLGTFRKIISNAEDNKARKLAPKTLTNAKNDVYYSANLINQYSRSPSQYMASVENANKSVKLLDDVMNKLTGEAKGSSESTALKLVYQERELGNLSDRVGTLQSTLATSSEKMGEMNESLTKQEKEIARAKEKIKFQQAMNKVRTSFSDKEASVYQQGNNLIIRVKKMNFPSGDAAIPTSSIALLSRINSIIKELNPKEVIVEGHTDSTGRQGSNMMLSSKRAKAVKEYLSSLDIKYQIDARGFGESKPIADNKTKKGRTLNRRVDIVVKGEL